MVVLVILTIALPLIQALNIVIGVIFDLSVLVCAATNKQAGKNIRSRGIGTMKRVAQEARRKSSMMRFSVGSSKTQADNTHNDVVHNRLTRHTFGDEEHTQRTMAPPTGVFSSALKHLSAGNVHYNKIGTQSTCTDDDDSV